MFVSLLYSIIKSYGYETLDPYGNVTIKWDVMQENDGNTQNVRVTIVNNQLFRHIEDPGWKLSWRWEGNNGVIWNMWGAQAMEQGNCSTFKGNLPHSCEKNPVIIDLLPGAILTKQCPNCCKAGVLSSMEHDYNKRISEFQMHVGTPSSSGAPANNFSLVLPGYTCADPVEVPPSRFIEDQGRRTTQALRTWDVICSYSQYLASPTRRCCVSLSSFYDNKLVPCETCSCACEGQLECIREGKQPSYEIQHQPEVQCTSHMCPVRVHWHVKESYKQHWKVKITITNFNFIKNYSQWNLVVLHPNLKSMTEVFSFNYKPLYTYGHNDSGMFYGISYFNDILLQAGKEGNVQTEMLLDKEEEMFSFKEGWAFPRKIIFNGEECAMPSPVDYPKLPNTGYKAAKLSSCNLLLTLLISVVVRIY
ncbi:hypothetical protein Leryth_024306 [Lithospermum erythrorhizon]|nr:hypothetical protein Leryth_024306 [Lithospermum erythrorhizon]